MERFSARYFDENGVFLSYSLELFCSLAPYSFQLPGRWMLNFLIDVQTGKKVPGERLFRLWKSRLLDWGKGDGHSPGKRHYHLARTWCVV